MEWGKTRLDALHLTRCYYCISTWKLPSLAGYAMLILSEWGRDREGEREMLHLPASNTSYFNGLFHNVTSFKEQTTRLPLYLLFRFPWIKFSFNTSFRVLSKCGTSEWHAGKFSLGLENNSTLRKYLNLKMNLQHNVFLPFFNAVYVDPVFSFFLISAAVSYFLWRSLFRGY